MLRILVSEQSYSRFYSLSGYKLWVKRRNQDSPLSGYGGYIMGGLEDANCRSFSVFEFFFEGIFIVEAIVVDVILALEEAHHVVFFAKKFLHDCLHERYEALSFFKYH